MSVQELPSALHQPVPLHQVAREGRLFAWLAAVSVCVSFAVLMVVGKDLRAVLAPLFVTAAMTLCYLVVLTNRQGHLPLFEAATYFVLATAIYTIVPLLQFIMSGMECPNSGDYRLFVWDPTPQQFGGFAWRHVLLLTTFVATYLLVRGKRLWGMREFIRPPRTMLYVIVALVLVLNGYFYVLNMYFGPAVSVYEGGTGTEILELPLFVRQITNVLLIVRLTLKQCLVIVLLAYWWRRPWRIVLVAWIALETILTVWTLESRTATVLLVLTFVVGYHHVVRPIRVGRAFLAGAVLLGGFLIFGLFRDLGMTGLRANVRAAWGTPTEFIILYGNAYDIHMRKLEGSLPPVPPQLYFSDLYRLVPSQLLPFYKWDPSDWYVDVLDRRGTGMGFMFGIVAQSVLGYDWVELATRGFLLALFYAAAHRAWRRYSASFWATMGYMFILTWAYYAFRASSFEILYRLVYYLAPAVLLVKMLTVVFSGPLRTTPRSLRAPSN